MTETQYSNKFKCGPYYSTGPFGDLSEVDAEWLGQFGKRLVAFDGGHGHLRLEGRSVIPSRSLHRLAPLVHHHLVAFVKPGLQVSRCPIFRSPLWCSCIA